MLVVLPSYTELLVCYYEDKPFLGTLITLALAKTNWNYKETDSVGCKLDSNMAKNKVLLSSSLL